MRDFLPTEKTVRNDLLSKIVGSYASHGFQEIETPALEAIERLSSGDGGDQWLVAGRRPCQVQARQGSAQAW